jgi:hypothetical protein
MVVPLPLSLLLLINLHVLEFPLANNPDYDQHVFNPQTRGLRHRTKSMEDICHFLVGKLERSSLKQVSSFIGRIFFFRLRSYWVI